MDSITGDLAQILMDDGFRTAIRHGTELAEGQRLIASIRPERVQISAEKPAQEENVFSGVVDFVSYLGAYVIYMIRIDDGQALIRASEPIPSGRASFAEGDHVFASWDVDHVVYIQD